MPEPITIVGGGLAGLTLGIGLRQRGVPVTVWEAGRYPRHRVCGEFISGRGRESLAPMGLVPAMQVESVTSAAFFSGERRIASGPLPEAALCISRFVLDEWLAREFERLGGRLVLGERWVGEFGSGIVRASGRRATPVKEGRRLFGLKVHARGVRMEAGLEMHFLPSGYVGLCRLPDAEVNVCGLFRSETAVPDLVQRWRDWLAGPPGSILNSRLSGAQFEEGSFCSIAGLCLTSQRARALKECCIGDALTMIPPVTGNGMSMAFESAELAVEPLYGFSRGDCSWVEAADAVATLCDERFAARLHWAAALQQVLFQPVVSPVLLFFAARSERLWKELFTRTR